MARFCGSRAGSEVKSILFSLHFASLPAVAPSTNVDVERASAMLSALAVDPQNLHPQRSTPKRDVERDPQYIAKL